MIIAIINNPVLRTKSNFLLATLAVTDLFVGAITAPLTTILIYFKRATPCGVIIANNFLTTHLCGASVFLLSVISIDRYYHFSKLHSYYIFMSKKRIAISIVTSFMAAAICAFLYITKISLLLFFVILALFFTIPLVTIIICYWKIFKIVRLKTQSIEERRKNNRVEVRSIHESHVSGARITGKCEHNARLGGDERHVQIIPPKEWPESNTEECKKQDEHDETNFIESVVCEEEHSEPFSRAWKPTKKSMSTEEEHCHEKPALDKRMQEWKKRLTAVNEGGLSTGSNRVDATRTAEEVEQQGMAGLNGWPRKTISQKQKLNQNTPRNVKGAKMMFTIVVVFCICWSPFVASSLYWAVRINQGESEEQDTIVYKWTLFLGFLNSSINPFIYCIRQTAIRKGIIALLGKINLFVVINGK